ncbi:MAG TPA: GAF domain-containing sensor histidine kinase [Actinomycetota bacterium]|nr:GAF domain-containing sensor histidine kinase [Actinomycetota bacterium]
MDSLGAVRCGLVALVLIFGLLSRETVEVSPAELTVVSAAYLLLALLTPWIVRRQPRSRAQWVIALSLLIDGVFLCWATYATGGTSSPLRFLLIVHVVAVTLLASYRTGLKIAVWDSLLYLVVMYAQAADLLPVHEALASTSPTGGVDLKTAALQLIPLWAAALVTATCAAASDRELRAQKVDLEELSAVLRDLDARGSAAEIPEILLDALCRVFGFGRGVVLASPEGDLSPMAYRGPGDPPDLQPGHDAITERAWNERRAQLASRLDPETDPRLAALLPGASNILVVPLLVDRGFRLGVVAVEHPSRRAQIKRWVVVLVEQFATHAALTLQNAWLLDELQRKLEENQALQIQLLSKNLDLEVKVAERTKDLTKTLQKVQSVDEQRRMLLARLVHAEEDERKRIAGDIHDDPIQKIVATSMRLQLLRQQLSDPEQLEVLDKLLSTVRGSIESLRHLIFELRPHALDEDGLGPALQDYLESIESDFEFKLEQRMEKEPPAELRVLLYRVAQEAITNIRKHARAERVQVLLADQDGGFLVRIADDGVGFTAPDTMQSAKGHLGVSAMRERVEMAGGWCQLRSLPGDGTTVEFWVPSNATRPEPTEADDDEVAVERRSEEAASVPLSVGGPTSEA